MPTLTSERITRIASEVLQAAGASAENGDIVGKHLADANLAGHDSHGFIRIPQYVRNIREGQLNPKAQPKVNRDSKATAQISGNGTFGQVAASFGTRLAMKKAKEYGVGMVSMYNLGHTGRIGTYPEMVAREGMAGIMFNGGLARGSVAPFGGRVPRVGTNPIAIAMPSNLEGPFFIDMATSAAAAGKVKLAEARGQSIPDDWVVDKNGRQTTDPAALSDGGAIQPLGGAQGFKGYGLAAMVEIFSGLLTGLGFGVEPTGKHNDGVFMAVFNVAAFRPLDQFKQEVTEFAEYLKATPTAEGYDEVLYPGEIEHQRMQKRLVEGIEVEDATWNKLVALAEKYDVGEIVA